MAERGVETELINFYDHEIQPCHKCNYECLAHLDPSIGHDLPCPIKDDVSAIWKKTWSADLLLMFVPNGGSPPALWLSFVQRYQSLWRQEPKDLSEKFSGAVVLSSPEGAPSGELTVPEVIKELISEGRKVIGFEVVNTHAYELGNVWKGLIEHDEIRQRLSWLVDQMLEKIKV
jgi:Multimeric flavodoxin WrbA